MRFLNPHGLTRRETSLGMPKLSQEFLKSILHYNEDTGVFTWIERRYGTRRGGHRAGSLHYHGYRHIMVNGSHYHEHRLAYLYMTGALPLDEIDHINGIRDDNRWGNLRAVSKSENNKNKKHHSNNTSGVMGVYWHKRTEKWMAYISVDRRRIHLGLHANLFDAASARKSAEARYGFHENHGRAAA